MHHTNFYLLKELDLASKGECKHKPHTMGYMEWSYFISEIQELPLHKQPKQMQCKTCKKWFFKSEF